MIIVTIFLRWDNVTIYESLTGTPAAGPYCGYTIPSPSTYTSSGNWAAIKFISDVYVAKYGFQISYSCKAVGSTTSTTTTTVSTTSKNTAVTTTFKAPSTTTGISGDCGKKHCLSYIKESYLYHNYFIHQLICQAT